MKTTQSKVRQEELGTGTIKFTGEEGAEGGGEGGGTDRWAGTRSGRGLGAWQLGPQAATGVT